jgi:hypothetical protein
MVSKGFDIALSDINDTPGAEAAFLEGWQTVFVVLIAIGALGLVLSLVQMRSGPARRRARIQRDRTRSEPGDRRLTGS